MRKEFANFRKSMTGKYSYRRIEDFTDLDWRLIEMTVGILEKHPSPIAYGVFRRELARAANISLLDAGWYITDVLTFDPIIKGKPERVLEIKNRYGRYSLCITEAFKKYYDERKTT